MLTYDLQKRGRKSLYEYLYGCIKQDILEGRLEANDKLPSKRELARHHQISLKTVENAYEQLITEGYLYAREKKGYFVMSLGGEIKKSAANQYHTPFSVYMGNEGEEKYFVDFTANTAAIALFPFDTWAKVMRNVMSQREKQLLVTVPYQGIYELRNEIAKYLYGFRGMQVSPDQIVIGAGTEYLYGRLLQLLGREKVYAVENPGYFKIPQIFQAHQVNYKYVGIDEEGVIIDELRKSSADVVHVSPGHHYPTGSIMPIGRRRKLLEWAEEDRERYIIEDDYDSEFRFTRMPVAAIQSLNHNHRVIYLNTFSKTMAPSLRISYMVLPLKLMERYRDTMSFYSCTVSAFEQYAMAEFMKKGYFERHIHRMKHYYRKKRDTVLQVLREAPLAEHIEIEEQDAGNHFLMRLHTGLSDTELKWLAREQGIKLDCLSEYYEWGRGGNSDHRVLDAEHQSFQEKLMHTIIVNYSDLEEKSFGKALEILNRCM